MRTPFLALALAAVLALPAFADERGREVEAFLREYTRLWNAGDAATITDKVYRFDIPGATSTKAGLEAEFARLKSQGYDHSEIRSVEGCLLTADRAMVEMRYTRLKTDGTAMPPAERAGLYMLRKFPEGWRITQLIGMGAGSDLACKSLAE